jgi:hypothetical protein
MQTGKFLTPELYGVMWYMRRMKLLKPECADCDLFPCIKQDPITKKFIHIPEKQGPVIEDADWQPLGDHNRDG